MPVTKRREWLPIGGITAMAAVARLAAIRQPMRFDEAISWAYYVGRSWNTIVTSYTYPNNHVLYSLLAKLAASPFKYQPWALRIPAFMAGLVVVMLLWKFGERLTEGRTALLGAALSAGSTELTLFSTNARGYTIVTACFLGMLIVADRLIDRVTARDLGVLGFLACVGLYAVPTMLYPISVVGVWLALNVIHVEASTRRRFAAQCLGALAAGVVVAGLLYLPIIRSAGLSALTANRFVTPTSWAQFTLDAAPMLEQLGTDWSSPFSTFYGYLLLGVAALGFMRREPRKRSSLALATVVACGALLLATHRMPFARVWIFLLPLYYLAVARGVWTVVDTVAKRRMPHADWACVAVAAGMVALLINTKAVDHNDDTGAFRSASRVTAFLTPQLRKGDRVLATLPANGPLLYYLAQAGGDSSSLTLPYEKTQRAFLILQSAQGQDIRWAFANILDTANWRPPQYLTRFPDAEVWLAEKR